MLRVAIINNGVEEVNMSKETAHMPSGQKACADLIKRGARPARYRRWTWRGDRTEKGGRFHRLRVYRVMSLELFARTALRGRALRGRALRCSLPPLPPRQGVALSNACTSVTPRGGLD